MRAGAVLMAALLVMLTSVTGCTDRLPLESTDLGMPGAVVLTASDRPVAGVIVYFHGSDQTATVIKEDAKHAAFFEPLLRAGYAVAATDADGNAFGNPASREAYRTLVRATRTKYGAGPVFFVAESMGALAALALIAEDHRGDVRGMVGISPLMGLPVQARAVPYIAGAWGGPVPAAADPLSWPPESFADRHFRLYFSRDDRVIPADASAAAFAARFGTVADVQLVDCLGDHVDKSCYQGEDALAWMSGLRR